MRRHNMRLPDVPITIGADPEFFFSHRGEVVGSERIISPDGIQIADGSSFQMDGVQVEMHPLPASSTDELLTRVACCFRELQEFLETRAPEINLDWRRTIRMKPQQLAQLSERARMLGCDPSLNIYSRAVLK